jgi:hypothetical protein
MHARTQLITNCCTLSEIPGAYEWFDRHQKFVGEVSRHFKLEMNTLGYFFTCPHSSKSKGLMSTSSSAVPQKLFADIYGYELSPSVLVCGTHSWSLSKHINTPCITKVQHTEEQMRIKFLFCNITSPQNMKLRFKSFCLHLAPFSTLSDPVPLQINVNI